MEIKRKETQQLKIIARRRSVSKHWPQNATFKLIINYISFCT